MLNCAWLGPWLSVPQYRRYSSANFLLHQLIYCWYFGQCFPSFVDNKTALGQKPDSTVVPPISSREIPGHCSRINRLCENIGYNLTRIPNHFNQQNQNNAERELSQFTSMIQSNCSSVLRVFFVFTVFSSVFWWMWSAHAPMPLSVSRGQTWLRALAEELWAQMAL